MDTPNRLSNEDAVCKQPSSHNEQCGARIWTSSRDTHTIGSIVQALAKCKCNGVAKSASHREAASGAALTRSCIAFKVGLATLHAKKM